jgi:hypothetical protein
MLSILISLKAFAASNIDNTDKYAWNENSGWMNFNDPNGGVTVYSDHLYSEKLQGLVAFINSFNGY